MVNGDNLTICSNPYALLLYAAGGDWKKDPTLMQEPGTVQCYTGRFADGEYLCAFRSPIIHRTTSATSITAAVLKWKNISPSATISS